MPNSSALSLFIVAASILVFLPGPNTLYIIARSLQQGRRAGIVSSLGVQAGTKRPTPGFEPICLQPAGTSTYLTILKLK